MQLRISFIFSSLLLVSSTSFAQTQQPIATDRTLEFKGFNLNMTKQEVLATTNGKFWDCSLKDDKAFERCVILFMETPECPLVQGNNPITGQRQLQANCPPGAVLELKDKPQNLQNLAFVGSAKVKVLSALFYNGKVGEYNFVLRSLPPEIETGLVSKYGQPTRKSEVFREWAGNDEVLAVVSRESRIVFRRPSVKAIYEERAKNRNR